MRKKRIALSQVEAGQAVADPVENSSGATLCPSGTVLTQRLLERLRNAGIAFVVVEREDDGEDDTRPQRLAIQKARFENVEDPILLRLKPIMEHVLRDHPA